MSLRREVPIMLISRRIWESGGAPARTLTRDQKWDSFFSTIDGDESVTAIATAFRAGLQCAVL